MGKYPICEVVMVFNVLAHVAQMVSSVDSSKRSVAALLDNSKSFRYRQNEVVTYWRKAAEKSFGSDHAAVKTFKTLGWVPADAALEAKQTYSVVEGKTGTYAAVRTAWDYTLV
jgi:hypothetical protein